MDKKSESQSLVISTESGMQAKAEMEIIQLELEKYRIYIKSGLLPAHIKTPEQALVIAQMGKELGIKPISALNCIYAPNNTPQLMVTAQQKRLQDAGVWWQSKRNYAEEEISIGGGKKFINKVTEIEFYRKAPDGTILKETGYFDRKMSVETIVNSKDQTLADKENWKRDEAGMIWNSAFRKGAKKIAGFALIGFDRDKVGPTDEVTEQTLPKPDYDKETDVS